MMAVQATKYRLGLLFILVVLDLAVTRLLAAPGPMPAQPAKSVAVPPAATAPAAPGSLLFMVHAYDGTQKCLDYTVPKRVTAPVTNPSTTAREPDRLAEKKAIETLPGDTLVNAPPKEPGPPVFLNDCALAHPLLVQEINSKHEVVLHAGDKVLGITTRLVNAPLGGVAAAPAPVADVPLELQDRGLSATLSLDKQIFALDGDSIILASSRDSGALDLVVKIQNSRGANGTALVVGQRNLADSEFWDFVATDGSGADPTSGFMHPSTVCDFANDLLIAGWGSVIKIDAGVSLDFGLIDVCAFKPTDPNHPVIPICTPGQTGECLRIPDGVTIRGDRRGTLVGPLLSAPDSIDPLFEMYRAPTVDPNSLTGNYVRITGLRIQGPSRSTDGDLRQNTGMNLVDSHIVMIDHNDLSNWTNATINVYGATNSRNSSIQCQVQLLNEQPAVQPSPLSNVFIARNFIHHNERWGSGYGSVMSEGGNATMEGNIYLMNRHAIADDGTELTRYNAWDNLVLSNVPTYYPSHGPQQDFDVHGTDPSSGSHHVGGVAGRYIDIGWNTFFGGDHNNLSLRGYPCDEDYFHNNVTKQGDQGGAINSPYVKINQTPDPPLDFEPVYMPRTTQPHHGSIPCRGGGCNEPPPLLPAETFPRTPYELYVYGNTYNASPTDHLKVGDFDGDGVQDLFLATGSSWFYSPGGVAEWRYLNGGKTDSADSLLFGDFDGDGRTDVVGKNGRFLMVSWGGQSDWEILNETDAPISDLAVGNFVDDYPGDKRDDILWADGTTWRVASGGSGPFKPVNTSSFRISDMRFGDFNGDGKTDIFAIEQGTWHVSYSAQSGWTALPVSLTNTVNGLVVADFNGDGRADVATSNVIRDSNGNISGFSWSIWFNGTSQWTTTPCPAPISVNGIPFQSPCVPITAAAGVGTFDGGRIASVLLWGRFEDGGFNPRDLSIAPGGNPAALAPRSRQEMR